MGVLTKIQIEEAKKLRSSGYSKRKLAIYFGVSPTTIWENVFLSERRKRIYVYKKKVPVERCITCGVKIYRGKQGIFHNLKVGKECLACFLERNGLTYSDIVI